VSEVPKVIVLWNFRN